MFPKCLTLSISSTTFTSWHLGMTSIKSLHVNFLQIAIIFILLFWKVYFGVALILFLRWSFFIAFSSLSWSSIVIFVQIIIVGSLHHFVENKVIAMFFRYRWIKLGLSFRILFIRLWCELVGEDFLWLKLTRIWRF